MKKAIVTTTINPPTEAILKYIEIAERDDWTVIIVGDKKTPHEDYVRLAQEHGCVAYLPPEKQEAKYRALSDLIGWNCIQRRNLGFIEAYNMGCEIIATIDDDNIPYSDWGQNLAFGQNSPTAHFLVQDSLFDPLSVTAVPRLWHRGFPHELLAQRTRVKFAGKKLVKGGRVLVQADLWDGEPDVDAVARIALGPFDVRFEEEPFHADKPGPFNSQNTFLHRDCFPTYFLFPHIGRMDDIWASYVLQREHPGTVLYGRASVYQERNVHNLAKDLENELIGYKNTLSLTQALYDSGSVLEDVLADFLPEPAIKAYAAYRDCFKANLSTGSPQDAGA